MSKEEIVRDQYEKMFGTQKYDNSVNRKMNFEYFSPAMDQYAKQECAGFVEWVDELVYNNILAKVRARSSDYYGQWVYDPVDSETQYLTTEELYTLFTQRNDVTHLKP
jgi:hypothetical protein